MVTEAARRVAMRFAEGLANSIKERYIDNLENYYIPTIINLIMTEYDIELTGRVTDRRARTNPIYYEEEFEDALQNYNYIIIANGKVTLSVPETNTFNWHQGRLKIIENIVEGTIGKFIEVDEEQYVSLFTKRPTTQPFDKDVPIKERIYLLRYTGDVRRRWKSTYPKKQPVEFPFSNQPPIDIFASANDYVNENINKWVEEAIRESNKEMVR